MIGSLFHLLPDINVFLGQNKYFHPTPCICYLKVETIGDAYMVVGGVPEASDIHAWSVANMSIAMLISAGEVNSPATGKPLQVGTVKSYGFNILMFPTLAI